MSWLDALVHSFTTISLGGFSSHDASLAHFDSIGIELVAIVFMVLACINFASHFRAWQERSVRVYRYDSELPYFMVVLAASVIGVAIFLWANGVYPDLASTLRYAAFNTISVATIPLRNDRLRPVAGVRAAVADIPGHVRRLLSSAGGASMIRAMILYRQVYREFTKLAHPSAVTPLKIGDRVVPDQVVFSVLAFFFAWLATLVSMTLLLTLSGLDAITAFSAIVASLNNIGPGLHQVGPAANFSVLSDRLGVHRPCCSGAWSC
jgi:trk system potassium uptake protein TrkH